MIFVINHHTRKFNDKKMPEPYLLFTDHTDYGKMRNHMKYVGIIDNYIRVLNHPCKEDWRIIMQDDVEFHSDLFCKIRHVLKSSPKTLVSFYNPTNRSYMECFGMGLHALKTHSNWWGQCVAVHQLFVDGFLKWFSENYHGPEIGLSEDRLINSFSVQTRQPVYAVVPSLTQHEGYCDSVFNHPARVGKYWRKSSTYDPDFDVLGVDWEKEFQNPYLDKQKKSWIKK